MEHVDAGGLYFMYKANEHGYEGTCIKNARGGSNRSGEYFKRYAPEAFTPITEPITITIEP